MTFSVRETHMGKQDSDFFISSFSLMYLLPFSYYLEMLTFLSVLHSALSATGMQEELWAQVLWLWHLGFFVPLQLNQSSFPRNLCCHNGQSFGSAEVTWLSWMKRHLLMKGHLLITFFLSWKWVLRRKSHLVWQCSPQSRSLSLASSKFVPVKGHCHSPISESFQCKNDGNA